VLLARLTLVDLRNYEALSFEPPEGLSLLVGPNGQGKSNLLEAIALLATAKSFRTSHERELIRDGCERATVAGDVVLQAGFVRLGCTIARNGAGTRKTYAVNGKGVRFASYLGNARVVTFVPADLDLAGGAPAARRTFLNAALAQEDRAYYASLAAYQKYVTQKNAMLRGAIGFDGDLLDTYDERLAQTGAALVAARRRYVDELADAAAAAYDRIAGGRDGGLRVRYAPNASEDELPDRIKAARPLETARRRALVGPHRDDFELALGQRPLAAYGSQGQQRSAVLALKIAEYNVMTARSGEPPLLLLDDVLSELDPERQAAFLGALDGLRQAFVTATVRPQGVDEAATYRVEAARVERVA